MDDWPVTEFGTFPNHRIICKAGQNMVVVGHSAIEFDTVAREQRKASQLGSCRGVAKCWHHCSGRAISAVDLAQFTRYNGANSSNTSFCEIPKSGWIRRIASCNQILVRASRYRQQSSSSHTGSVCKSPSPCSMLICRTWE